MKFRTLIVVLAVAATAIAVGVSLSIASGGGPEDASSPLGISPKDATGLPSEKAKLWEAEKKRSEDFAKSPYPTVTRPTFPTPKPRVVTTGIINHELATHGYFFTNAWRGWDNDIIVTVYAGRLRRDESTGVVVVQRETIDGASASDPVVHEFPGAGAIRVISEKDATLQFVTDKGELVELDSNSGQLNAEGGSPCCSLQLDLQPSEAGVQAVAGAAVGIDLSIDVIFGEQAGPVGALQFRFVYDDTILTPLAGGSGINGNPDLNDAVTGTAWSCSLPAGSGTADIDPATGAGHGVAMLSCFTTSSPVTITTGTVLATLRLHVASGAQADLVIANAVMGSHETVELGSCNPAVDVEMTCVGGTVNPQ